MKNLLSPLKNPKHHISLLILAGIVLFMQCYLLQHQVEHHSHDHHTHEVVEECQLCLGAYQISQFVLPTDYHLSLGLMGLFIVLFYHPIIVFSARFFLPLCRAPPAFI